jgi:hypothetical protein
VRRLGKKGFVAGEGDRDGPLAFVPEAVPRHGDQSALPEETDRLDEVEWRGGVGRGRHEPHAPLRQALLLHPLDLLPVLLPHVEEKLHPLAFQEMGRDLPVSQV